MTNSFQDLFVALSWVTNTDNSLWEECSLASKQEREALETMMPSGGRSCCLLLGGLISVMVFTDGIALVIQQGPCLTTSDRVCQSIIAF